MVNEASTMEPASNGGGGGGGDDGVKEASVVVTQLVLEQGGDQGVQLRSSARVSKKLKLDSQAATAAVTVKKVGEVDDKPSSQQTSPVSSVGSGVGSVQNASVGVSAAAANAPTAAVVAAEPARGRGRRGNETSLWSMDDKNAFFESLNEFGKDFDAIHHHIEMKARKRGEQEPKSRDQVRHFYYRTWNKISKHLTFPEGTTKMTQELYGLVNYGEMRKKIGYPYTAKNSHKLKELIFLGSTQIRIKGKTWRIKTPICKALRKLNALEDCCEEVLPPRVTVELRPRDNASWARVQSLAFNPRIVAELSLHRRLRSLIAHLQSRWRHTDDKLRQTVAGGDGGPSVNNHNTTTTSQCLAESGIHPLPDLPLTTDPIDLPDLCSSLPPTTQPPLSETSPTIITSLSNLQSNNFSNSVTSNSVSSSSIPSISQPISCLTLSSDHHSSSFASQSPSSSSSFEHPSSSQTLSSCSSSSSKPSSFYFSSVTSSSFTTTSSFSSSSPSSSLPPSSSSLPPSSSSQQSSISSSSQLPSCSSSSITSSSLSLAAQLFPAPCDDTMELCVAPQQGTHMTDASFKVSAIATSAKLSFLSFTDRQGKDKSHILAELQAASKNSRQRAGALKRQRSDSSCEKGGVTRGGAADGELQADGMEQLDLQLAEHLPSLGCELLNNADQVLSDDGLGDTSPVKGGGVGDVGDLEPDDVGGCSHESVAETRARIATNLLKRVRHGWTAENADATCIGEVYVMFGSDSRLVLEYWWRKKGETLDLPPDAPRPEPPSTPVTTALQKLLSLAKLSYSKTRLTCPCGHVCNQPTPDTTNQVKSNQIIHQNPSTTGAVGNQAVSARSGGVNRVRGAPSKGEGGVQVPPQAASVPMDGVFRKPVLAPLRPKADTGDQFKFKAQLDKFKLLRFCNRRGRNSRSKNVVVPRILPLLPKVPADKQLMFKLRPAAPGGGVPGAVLNKEAVTGQQLLANQLITLTPTTVANFTMPLNSGQLFMPLQLSQPVGEPVPKAETVEVVDEIKEDESNGGPELLNGPKVISIEDEPPPSPMGLLKEEMLINTDDYSLSSLLGHLESPDKNCASAFGDDARHIADVTCDDSRLPDVDAQLESLMCEDSVDYMGKFADLAAKLTSDSLSHDTD